MICEEESPEDTKWWLCDICGLAYEVPIMKACPHCRGISVLFKEVLKNPCHVCNGSGKAIDEGEWADTSKHNYNHLCVHCMNNMGKEAEE